MTIDEPDPVPAASSPLPVPCNHEAIYPTQTRGVAGIGSPSFIRMRTDDFKYGLSTYTTVREAEDKMRHLVALDRILSPEQAAELLYLLPRIHKVLERMTLKVSANIVRIKAGVNQSAKV